MNYTDLIRIENNPNLQSIQHLSRLTQIGDSEYPSPMLGNDGLLILENVSLQSLEGLENVTGFIGDVIIVQNPSLSNLCSILGILQSQEENGYFVTVANNYINNPSVNQIDAANCDAG